MIIRKQHRTHYTVVDNALIEDQLLSWKAKGLLIYLLSKPDGWKVRMGHLVSAGTLGREGVRGILSELEDQGYIVRLGGLRTGGKFDGPDVEVHECRQDKTPGGTVDGFAAPVETANDKTPGHTGDGFTVTVEPAPVEPSTVNPTLVKTEEVITEKTINTKNSGDSENSDQAGDLTRLAWTQTPKPTPKFIAVRGIIQRALDAGHTYAAIEAAITQGTVNVWTLAGIETGLARADLTQVDTNPHWQPSAADLRTGAVWDEYDSTGQWTHVDGTTYTDDPPRKPIHPEGGLIDGAGYRYHQDNQGRRKYVAGSGPLSECVAIPAPESAPQPPSSVSVEDAAAKMNAMRAQMSTIGA